MAWGRRSSSMPSRRRKSPSTSRHAWRRRGRRPGLPGVALRAYRRSAHARRRHGGSARRLGRRRSHDGRLDAAAAGHDPGPRYPRGHCRALHRGADAGATGAARGRERVRHARSGCRRWPPCSRRTSRSRRNRVRRARAPPAVVERCAGRRAGRFVRRELRLSPGAASAGTLQAARPARSPRAASPTRGFPAPGTDRSRHGASGSSTSGERSAPDLAWRTARIRPLGHRQPDPIRSGESTCHGVHNPRADRARWSFGRGDVHDNERFDRAAAAANPVRPVRDRRNRGPLHGRRPGRASRAQAIRPALRPGAGPAHADRQERPARRCVGSSVRQRVGAEDDHQRPAGGAAGRSQATALHRDRLAPRLPFHRHGERGCGSRRSCGRSSARGTAERGLAVTAADLDRPGGHPGAARGRVGGRGRRTTSGRLVVRRSRRRQEHRHRTLHAPGG